MTGGFDDDAAGIILPVKSLHMKCLLLLLLFVPASVLLSQTDKKQTKAKQEIAQAEKSFCDDLNKKGVAYAFGHYAADDAVILREQDSLITGREAIIHYYSTGSKKQATAEWSADFVDVSADGTMGYTYGKYTWKTVDDKGNPVQYSGTFHTVWKRQKDGSWKYVWD